MHALPTIEPKPPGVVAVTRSSTERSPQVIGCRFLGVVKLPATDKQRAADLEVYLHPCGALFAVDATMLANKSLQIMDFIQPSTGRVLDLSDEPTSRLLNAGSCRFLHRADL